MRLVEEVVRDPFAGIGKPEPLRHKLAGAWSRRLTDEHRVVYRVDGGGVHLLSARSHYA
jgi:toxin YoeB